MGGPGHARNISTAHLRHGLPARQQPARAFGNRRAGSARRHAREDRPKALCLDASVHVTQRPRTSDPAIIRALGGEHTANTGAEGIRIQLRTLVIRRRSDAIHRCIPLTASTARVKATPPKSAKIKAASMRWPGRGHYIARRWAAARQALLDGRSSGRVLLLFELHVWS